MEKMDENNQLLREELREVNQKNIDKLDERIELLREELCKKINDNSESTNKKLEEETTGIKQQITEVDKKWSQTNQEIQDFKEEVHTKFTNIEENNWNKIEENQRETQEELGKVRSQFTEKCDGIEVAMTNITGQVRQNQEEIEFIRNRPTLSHHLYSYIFS